MNPFYTMPATRAQGNHWLLASWLLGSAMAALAALPEPPPQPLRPTANAQPGHASGVMGLCRATPGQRALRRSHPARLPPGCCHAPYSHNQRAHFQRQNCRRSCTPLACCSWTLTARADHRLHWMRAPRHAPRGGGEIERTVRCRPYPSPAAWGKVTYTDTWLWDKSGHFQLDTLTEGQL